VNRPVDLSVPHKLLDDADSATILSGSVIAAITAATGRSNFSYTLNYIHCWADSSLDAVTLDLEDTVSGVITSDNGATTHRARVGMHYTKVLQVPRKSGTLTTDIATIKTSVGNVSDLDLRFGVTVW